MGRIRSFLLGLVPNRLARSMEAESRGWVVRCPCGAETSVWEMGGIRWGASGNPRRRVRCGDCGDVFFGRLERRKDSAKLADPGLD